ncbi:MAG: hypothetical protein K6F34_02395 [Lachnospiraceae bacterium]|nr:hypothetical protein [Lachnospiraceae bacterium]
MPKKNKGSREGSLLRDTILNTVIVLLTIVLFIMAMVLSAKTKPRVGTLYGPESADSMIRMLERGRYQEISESRYSNEMMGAYAESRPSYLVPYAAADYYDSALISYGYSLAGEKNIDPKYGETMEQSREALGEYEYIADEIDDFLSHGRGSSAP